MKINENIVLSMVAPHVVDNALTYDKFDELFAMLSRPEQYSVTDLLAAHNIELRDADDDPAQAFATEPNADAADQPLFDNNLFGGNDPMVFTGTLKKGAPRMNEILAKAAQEGNDAAMERLYLDNTGLVMKWARKYTKMYGSCLTEEDLFMEGVHGLLKAVDRFNYDLGWKFSTYAEWWIRQAIFREIENNGTVIRIPVHKKEQIRRVMRIYNDLCQQGVSSAERIQAVVKALEDTAHPVSESQVLECIQLHVYVEGCTSLDMPMKDDSDAVLGDFIPTDMKDNPEILLEQACMKSDVMNVVHTLTAREQQVIMKRYGLDDLGRRTLEEVGKELGVTRERIRQIEATALRKLRHPSRSRLLKDYLEVA